MEFMVKQFTETFMTTVTFNPHYLVGLYSFC
jgi:hypothetical protein